MIQRTHVSSGPGLRIIHVCDSKYRSGSLAFLTPVVRSREPIVDEGSSGPNDRRDMAADDKRLLVRPSGARPITLARHRPRAADHRDRAGAPKAGDGESQLLRDWCNA